MTSIHEPLLPETVAATRERVAEALDLGGRVRLTVTSKASGKHLSIRLTCKRRKDDGHGFVSRARKEGRVGLAHADVVFADADDLALAGEVGRLYLPKGQWYDRDRDDDPRASHYAWAARQALAWAAGGFDLTEVADVEMQTECSVCGHRLTDPESIDRGIGPECYGKLTGSTHI